MKNAWVGAWMLAALPMAAAQAQDEASTDEVLDAVAEDAYEDESSAESVDTVPVDSGEEADAAAPAESWRLYVGLDQAGTTLSQSGLPPQTPHEFDSGFYRLRAGRQLGQGVGIELQYGFEETADQPGEVATEDYYGLFLVPSTNLFETIDLTFPVGYARSTVGGVDLDSVAFGLAAELPLQAFSSSLPDLRLVLGWMTYYQKRDARLYGFNLGLRFDFSTDSLDFWSGE